MGARPSSFKTGGGFLNGVNARITDYQFTDEFNGEPFVPGKIPSFDNPKLKVDKPHNLNILLSVRVDDAEEDTVTTLKVAGEFDGWKVSDDGHAVVGVDEEGNELPEKGIPGGSQFGKFITSLCKPDSGGPGFPEERLPEDALDYTAIIGTRARFIQRTDAERTKKYGQKKGKNGKAYDRKDLVIDEVYELPDVDGEVVAAPAAPAKKAGVSKTQPAGQAKPLGAPKSGTKAAPAKAAAVASDATAKTEKAILDILIEDGGSVVKTKLSMRIRKAYLKDDAREDMVKLAFENDFLLDETRPWTFDRATNTLTVKEG